MGVALMLAQQALGENMPEVLQRPKKPRNDLWKATIPMLDDVAIMAISKLLAKKAAALPGGLGEGKPDSEFSKKQIEMGKKVEKEHTADPALAKEIVKDHLTEFPTYYTALKNMETKLEGKKASAELVKQALPTWKLALKAKQLGMPLLGDWRYASKLLSRQATPAGQAHYNKVVGFASPLMGGG